MYDELDIQAGQEQEEKNKNIQGTRTTRGYF